ncbi:hypothetical protein DL990_20110 [Amycolatopsis sp. WAC 01416]|uniref:hypothetical protein n=1 Tax=Amycolatopsis sp. WAC 01416 TaxID=2203196 RepID=UPI000F7AF9D5|nr:hypothetical protein [Amycolatopsis sp. WAC 01416]RSN32225.1 hypothetical protein DL990_20110 [Amycolatopsis sp. WAC 01416]
MADDYAGLRPGWTIRHNGRKYTVHQAPVRLGNGLVSIEVRDQAADKIRTIRAAAKDAPRVITY